MLPKGKEIAASASCSDSAGGDAGGGIFPPNVISDILSRLPVKTLFRFKCVSKQWHKLVSQPEFISAHLRRSPASLLIHAFKSPYPRRPRLFNDILIAAKKAKAALEKARLESGEEIQSQPEEKESELQPDGHAIYTYRLLNRDPDSTVDRILKFPGSGEAGVKNLEVFGVENGVACVALEPFFKKFVLWNPATRSSKTLPDPSIRLSKNLYKASSVGFGFDPVRNDYKVIRIMRHTNFLVPDVAEFLNIRVGAWRRVRQYPGRPTRFWVERQACDAVVKGVPYWRATAAFNIYNLQGVPDTEDRGTLLWFDVRDDVFDLEQCKWVEEKREMCFGEIRDCLGVALWEKEGIEVWVKEGDDWSRKYRVGLFPWVGHLPWVGPFDWNKPAAKVVGFYGERGIVQEVGWEGNLIMFDLQKTGIDSVNGQDWSRKKTKKEKTKDLWSRMDDVINVEDSIPFSLKTMRYRESLIDVQRIGEENA